MSIIVLLLVFTFIGAEVANQVPTLGGQFREGIAQIENWLQDGPLHWDAARIEQLSQEARTWIAENQTNSPSAIGGAERVAEGVTALFLALFTSIFFLAGGERILGLVALAGVKRQRPRVDGAGHVAWTTFARLHPGHRGGGSGDQRGPSWPSGSRCCGCRCRSRWRCWCSSGPSCPIIGAPIAMIAAAVVALAAQGPLVALGGGRDDRADRPVRGPCAAALVMAKAVSIHPRPSRSALPQVPCWRASSGTVVAVPLVSVVTRWGDSGCRRRPDSPTGHHHRPGPTGTGAGQGNRRSGRPPRRAAGRCC